MHMLLLKISDLKGAQTYKSRRVLLLRKTVYSGISKLLL